MSRKLIGSVGLLAPATPARHRLEALGHLLEAFRGLRRTLLGRLGALLRRLLDRLLGLLARRLTAAGGEAQTSAIPTIAHRCMVHPLHGKPDVV